ncbi:MAG: 1-acyl-sn-glycerol-3-phosphate acyltransferase [Fidelibacterota bacterium]|nr:MAG: 1-acyl-sn-glycerol-3-phosphate acyltransferase [Candidatus Neomarinimicrobiota bacterium]
MRLVFIPLIRILHRPVLIGREHMPSSGPCFIIANHCGTYDSFFINYFIKREAVAGIMTDEFLREGFMAYLFKQLGVVATRKFQTQTTPVRDLIRLVRDKRMIVLMPEGESNWDGATLPTVASTGKLFRAMKVPVHPVIIHNGYLAYPRWANWPRTAKIHVEFLPPFTCTPDMTDEEVATRVDEAIRWDAVFDDEPFRPRWVASFRPAKRITRLIFRCPNCGAAEGLEEIRGRFLNCRSCGERWRVRGDATLTNTRTGERRTATEIFRQICEMARPLLDFGEQGKGLIHTADIPVYKEVEYPHQELLGRFDCILREDRIDLLPKNSQEVITIMLTELHSLSNELKVKCQLRTAEDMYQLHFERGSPLQWQIYLKDMLPHLDDRLIRPTDFATGHAPK